MLLHRCASCGCETAPLRGLQPVCDRCGAGLPDPRRSRDADLRAAVAVAVLVLLTAPLLHAAAKVGWQHGGPLVGGCAFVLAALAAFVGLTPQRRAPRR